MEYVQLLSVEQQSLELNECLFDKIHTEGKDKQTLDLKELANKV